jgi:hypothetical protein
MITFLKKQTRILLCVPPFRYLRRMSLPSDRSKSFPVSRELVRMIRTSSQLQSANLGDHMRAVDVRQAKAVEFYLRACALRLEQGL